MAQAQGSEGRLIIMPEDTFKTLPVTTVHDCETAWDELVDGDVTATADTAVFKQGTKSCKLVVADACSAGDILATDSLAAKDLSSYSKIGMWVYSSVTLASGDIKLLLDDTAQCASPLETLDVPAITSANTWTYVKMSLAAAATDTAIISVGLKMSTDKGAFTLYVDNIQALNANAQIVPFKSESLKFSRDLATSEIIGNNRNPRKPSRGNTNTGGDIPTQLNAYMTTLLKHLFGSVTTTDLTGKYQHVFKLGSLPVGFSIEKQFTDIAQYIAHSGCRVNSLSVKCPATGKIDTQFTLMGAKENAATTLSSLDSSPTDWGHNPFDAFEASIKEGGSTVANITSIDFTMENNLDGSVYVIGGAGERASLPAGRVKVSGNLEALFENMSLYTKAINDTETSLQLILTKGTGDGTAGNEYLDFSFEEVILGPNTPSIEGPTGVLLKLPFEAYLDNGSGNSAIICTVKNTQSEVI